MNWLTADIVFSENTPIKWLLKEGGGCILEICDISFENTSHAQFVLALFM